MPATYEPIATVTMNGSSSTTTFTNISQAYTDLRLVCSFVGVASCNYSTRVGNGSIDSGNNYSNTRLYGTGSSATSDRNSNVDFFTSNITVGANGSNAIIDIMNYSNTTTYKTSLQRFNDAGAIVFAVVGMWRNTSAINQLQVYSTNSVNFASGSTFTLYGIKAA